MIWLQKAIIFREILSFAQLKSFSISFCRRSCSEVCHALAALGSSQSMTRCGCIKEVLDDISVMVAYEFTEPV
jgi:hypothetical protein